MNPEGPEGDRLLPDVIGPGLRVLFCGINPSRYSAAAGHHFARPGNRFWKVLAAAGLTPRLLSPDEDGELPAMGMGVTNLVARPTARADELSADELRAGVAQLVATAERWSPVIVAVVGMGAYRTAFGRPRATIGPQPEPIGPARAWLLPNPSGLQAYYQLPELTDAFTELAAAADMDQGRRSRRPSSTKTAGPVSSVISSASDSITGRSPT